MTDRTLPVVQPEMVYAFDPASRDGDLGCECWCERQADGSLKLVRFRYLDGRRATLWDEMKARWVA